MSHKSLLAPCLYLVTDHAQLKGRDLASVIEQAVQGGVSVVQLREKGTSTRDFLELSQNVQKLLKSYNVPLIINDRIDIALAIHADGVHLGQSDMPFTIARKLLGPEAIIGASVETLHQAQEAEDYNCDYLGVSAIFASTTKQNTTQWGLSGLKKLSETSRHQLIAIGGINLTNIADVMKHGAHGAAVSSYLLSSPDPTKAASLLQEKMRKSYETK